MKNLANNNQFLIKNVKIVPGKSLAPNWKRDMQVITTGSKEYIDNIPMYGGHDWKNEIGKIIKVEINQSSGYYWIKFCGNKSESVKKIIEESLPENYDIHENPELTKIYDFIRDDIPIMFLTGGAGTGKSTFIKYIKKNLKKDMNKNYVVLAPTGVAAINVGGQTIHSFFGFKTDIFEDKDIDKRRINSVIDHTDLIIIDEISMVSSWMLDHIDYALRLRCDSNKVFGGKQMLFIGDCFQLPPIAENNEVKQKYFEKWDNTFFFAAKSLKNVDMKAIQLKKIYRQKDDEAFIHMLNRIRKCQSGYERDIEFLNQNCLIEKRLGTTNVPEECLFLSTKNSDVEKFNTLKMHNLQNKGMRIQCYEGLVSGKFNFEHFLTPKTLELCIGAKVMVTKNISSLNLVNGDMGKVINISKDFVEVEIKNERKQLKRETWQSLKYSWNEESNSIQQTEEGSFYQIPLKLGWAVTIHKSQGLTLDSVAIDVSDAWDSGQVYVALSRAKDLNGILLKNEIPVSAVKSNPYIKKIYEELFPESEKEDLYKPGEYENINFENSTYTIDNKKEETSVRIGNFNIELFPKDDYGKSTWQKFVLKTMDILLSNNLIPETEIERLLNDVDYCYSTFRCTWNGFKYTLLKENRTECYDPQGNSRYWQTNCAGYYVCSQWTIKLANNFANWLIALSKGKI